MAWAIIESISFGKFFPHGSLDTWRERMASYMENEMTEAERAEYKGRASTYCRRTAEKFRGGKGFLEDHEKPHLLVTDRFQKELADFLTSESGIRIVSAAFKAAVEAVEPDVHQFWPMSIKTAKGKATPGEFFGMIVGQKVASFDESKSDPESFNPYGSPGGLKANQTKKVIGGVALNRSAIGDAHMWLEEELWSVGVVVSDALHDSLVGKGLVLPKTHQFKEF